MLLIAWSHLWAQLTNSCKSIILLRKDAGTQGLIRAVRTYSHTYRCTRGPVRKCWLTYTLYLPAHTHTHTDAHTLQTHTLPPPHHLCAVCLKWQCLSVILRQIGREHRSIKGSHGPAEGWNNGWWKWQKTHRCSLLNGLCRGGNFVRPPWLYTEDKTAQLKNRGLFNRFCLCFCTLLSNSPSLKLLCQRTENVTAI